MEFVFHFVNRLHVNRRKVEILSICTNDPILSDMLKSARKPLANVFEKYLRVMRNIHGMLYRRIQRGGTKPETSFNVPVKILPFCNKFWTGFKGLESLVYPKLNK